jgi:quercetin dioxygenase-like cupin family protein
MVRRSMLSALAVVATAAFLSPVPARSPKESYPAVPLLSTGADVAGETIRYPEGSAHVTAAIVTLAPGARTILHKHGVPLFAYILKGTLTVNYGKQGVRTYRRGQAFMEAMDIAHYGMNAGKEAVRVLAVYMGAKGAENVIPVK